MKPSTAAQFSRISSTHARRSALGQRLEEDVVALKRDEDRHAERSLQCRNHAREQGVGQHDDVGLDLGREPADELRDLLPLLAVLPSEHGDGQVAELAVLASDGEPRHPAQQPAEVEQPVEEPRRVAEQPELLLQVDVDAAEEDAALADVVLVGADRRVGGDEQRVVARACTRAATSVLSRMQVPQYMPAAPAVMDAIRMAPPLRIVGGARGFQLRYWSSRE